VQNLEPTKRGLSVGITSVIAITIVALKKQKKQRGAEGGTSTTPLTEGSVDLNLQSGGDVSPNFPIFPFFTLRTKIRNCW
jgi:hypothetical protein